MTGFIVFLLVLSLLVFVHELGHFLAAKTFNIYCDRFSIGMPPRVWGFQWGETDYCIGALPFGGYVKMAGQEDAPLTDEEREQTYGHVPPDRWFNNKPVWQRIVVLLAGPLMNLALAFAVYLFIAGKGAEVPASELEARVGMIEQESPALEAPMWRLEEGQTTTDTSRPADVNGWRTGDLLLSQNGTPVKNIGEVAVNSILAGPGFEHEFLIERTARDGAVERYISKVVPEQQGEEEDYHRIGIAPFDGALVKELLPDSPAQAAGLQPEDLIVSVNGQPVDRGTFVKRVEDTPEGEALTLSVKRGEELLEKSLTPLTLGRMNEMFIAPHFNPITGENADAQPRIDLIDPAFEEKTGLKRKDRIVTIDGQPATSKALYELEKGRPGGSIKMEIERPAVLFGLLRPAATLTVDVPVASVRAIGVTLGSPMVFYRAEPSRIIPEAWAELKTQVNIVLGTLGALFSRTVSPKDLGGPVMIAQITMQAAELGWERLFRTTAFISLNLFILNLLPLPVLDGGQIVLNLIEGVRRKPLSLAFQERLQQVGVLLLIGLMLFVTWNDVNRIFSGLLM